MLALLVHGLVIVDNDVKGAAARRLYRDKLLVGVLVIEQIAGDEVALFLKALTGLNGGLRLRGRGFHGGIAVVLTLAAAGIGIGRGTKGA